MSHSGCQRTDEKSQQQKIEFKMMQFNLSFLNYHIQDFDQTLKPSCNSIFLPPNEVNTFMN